VEEELRDLESARKKSKESKTVKHTERERDMAKTSQITVGNWKFGNRYEKSQNKGGNGCGRGWGRF